MLVIPALSVPCGRPKWDRIFQSIAATHPATETGIFFCAPDPLGSSLHQVCN
ncbi:BZ3500_MvSof-1268-A1-R1_Chr5-2g07914 [Microbotryum saponariae]|uniref:BZ3500_MvSof-1268-A1-R1_Chr5-2g07914 protein n=1 Tax=Microbotryum saponariae TaxID=289078 RepID=A0A2X0KML3_9BASI|nr:BZ3500_MvSof-1268-A1-R1_Chr5-2g07914 [Microbotryum saponariae]SDA05783.1 BZ3501_MvSof-1269-A2-R1_Chr5-2g07736 [Microbotryum saponariae]